MRDAFAQPSLAIYAQYKVHVTTLFINLLYNVVLSRNFVAGDLMRKAATIQRDRK